MSIKQSSDDDRDVTMWAICRAAHENAMKRIAADDYNPWGDLDPHPGKGEPFALILDWLTFAFYCEGFCDGLEVSMAGTKKEGEK